MHTLNTTVQLSNNALNSLYRNKQILTDEINDQTTIKKLPKYVTEHVNQNQMTMRDYINKFKDFLTFRNKT